MLLTVAKIRESELYTMENEPVKAIDLMERAGSVFVERLLEQLKLTSFAKIFIFCGPGNNGGDGLVIARVLAEKNYPVDILICSKNGKYSEECKINIDRAEKLSLANCSVHYLKDPASLSFTSNALIIDALFGIGLNQPVDGYYAEIIQHVNKSQLPVIAVDIPSGLFADQHTSEKSACINANMTITFQFLKLAFLVPENERRTGDILLADIGLKIPGNHQYSHRLIDRFLAKELLRIPAKFSHKGDNGHGLLIAGSEEMPGAAIVASGAALRAGIGKITVHIPHSVANLIPIATPEAILSRDKNEHFFSGIGLEKFPMINAIAIGPGLGKNKVTVAGLKDLLDEINSPIILDADALNILSDNKTWIAYLPAYSILTPHFKEFERIAGKCENDFDRLQKVKDFSKKHELILILKGAHTVVSTPDGTLYFNTSGNPGLATAGSGDALTGILLALSAKGYSPVETAVLGVYLHGLAADLAVENHESAESLIASDIAKNLGIACKKIYGTANLNMPKDSGTC